MPIFLNKTQTLSSPHIVCVDLVLYLELFGYKFSFICNGVVLMLNLIIIIVIKKSPTHRSTGVGLDSYVELDIYIYIYLYFLTHHDRLDWKTPELDPTQLMYTLTNKKAI